MSVCEREGGVGVLHLPLEPGRALGALVVERLTLKTVRSNSQKQLG